MKKLFAGSLILFTISLAMLLAAVSIAGERTRVPFVGMEIGKPVTSGVSSMTVTNVQHTSGKTICRSTRIRISFAHTHHKNNSEKPFDVLPTTDTYVKTSSGEVSYVTPFADAPISKWASTARGVNDGRIKLPCSKNTAYKFYVESGWSGGAVSFMVQSDKHKQDSP